MNTPGAQNRRIRPKIVGLLFLATLPGLLTLLFAPEIAQGGSFRSFFLGVIVSWVRPKLERRVDPDDPHIRAIAEAIRMLTPNRLEQASIVGWKVTNLVDYTSHLELWGAMNYVPSIGELEKMRSEHGWEHWRGDCKVVAIVDASVLRALGFSAEIETSVWRRHAWVTVDVDGVRYDINNDSVGSHWTPIIIPCLSGKMLWKYTGEKRAALVTIGCSDEKGRLIFPTTVSVYPPFRSGVLAIFGAGGLLWIAGVMYALRKI